MKKLRLYIDTSILGGIFDTEDLKRVKTAQLLMELIKDGTYEGFISRLTIEEVFDAPEKIHLSLQNRIVETWNYKHMVNIAVRRLVNSVNLRMGYNPIEIISPEEVIGNGEMGL